MFYMLCKQRWLPCIKMVLYGGGTCKIMIEIMFTRFNWVKKNNNIKMKNKKNRESCSKSCLALYEVRNG